MATPTEAILRGGYAPDPVPEPGSPRWGLSLVLLPDARGADALAAVAERLRLASRNPHVAYDAASVHMTVRSLEGRRARVDDALVAHHERRIGAVLAGRPALRARFDGLALVRTGAVARGLPDPALAPLREALVADAQADARDRVPGGDGARPRDSAHASLLVLRPGRRADPGLVEAVERPMAAIETGPIRALWLVTYAVDAERIELERRARIAW